MPHKLLKHKLKVIQSAIPIITYFELNLRETRSNLRNLKLSNLKQFDNIIWTENNRVQNYSVKRRLTTLNGTHMTKFREPCKQQKNLVIDWTVSNNSAATTASRGRTGATSSSSLAGALHFFPIPDEFFRGTKQSIALEYGPLWTSLVLPFLWAWTRICPIGPSWHFSYNHFY